MRRRHGGWIGLLLVLLAALGWGQEPASGAADGGSEREDYRLQPGDLIRVQVYQEPDLDRELRISQEGEVALPLIGRVIARGLTVAALEETVRERYDRDYLVNPQVNVSILAYRERRVSVLGAVGAPQSMNYPAEESLTLVEAISRAGGFNRLADRRKVRVTRTAPDGQKTVFVVNVDELMSSSEARPWVLQVNDIVFVPEKIL